MTHTKNIDQTVNFQRKMKLFDLKPLMILSMILVAVAGCSNKNLQQVELTKSQIEEVSTYSSDSSYHSLENSMLSPVQPQGYEVIKQIHVDLDGDGANDWLIVSELAGQPDEERLFQIVQTQKNGQPIVFKNKGLLTCKNCGGTRTDDPIVKIQPISKGFILVTEGGSREVWSRAVTFKYSNIDKCWQLVEISEKNIDTQTGKSSKWLRSPKDFGKVNFQDSDFDLMSLLKQG